MRHGGRCSPTLAAAVVPHAACGAVVKFGSDDEAVAIANDCPFGLGSSVFSGSRSRARAIGARLEVRSAVPRRAAMHCAVLGLHQGILLGSKAGEPARHSKACQPGRAVGCGICSHRLALAHLSGCA